MDEKVKTQIDELRALRADVGTVKTVAITLSVMIVIYAAMILWDLQIVKEKVTQCVTVSQLEAETKAE